MGDHLAISGAFYRPLEPSQNRYFAGPPGLSGGPAPLGPHRNSTTAHLNSSPASLFVSRQFLNMFRTSEFQRLSWVEIVGWGVMNTSKTEWWPRLLHGPMRAQSILRYYHAEKAQNKHGYQWIAFKITCTCCVTLGIYFLLLPLAYQSAIRHRWITRVTVLPPAE